MGYQEEHEARAQEVIRQSIVPAVAELLDVFERYSLTQAQAATVAACALNRLPLKGSIPQIATVTLSYALNSKP